MAQSRNQHLIEAAQRKLFKLENAYLKAQEYIKSPQYHDDTLAAIQRIKDTVKTGPVSESEAVWAIGKVQMILEFWDAQNQIIVEYQSAKASLDNILREEGK